MSLKALAEPVPPQAREQQVRNDSYGWRKDKACLEPRFGGAHEKHEGHRSEEEGRTSGLSTKAAGPASLPQGAPNVVGGL